MNTSARLVATLTAPLPFSGADDAPSVLSRPGGWRLVQRGDTEVVVRDAARAGAAAPEPAEVRFPAPWPRRFGGYAVAPTGDLAVFAGPHALRAVDITGAVRWELWHRCWAVDRFGDEDRVLLAVSPSGGRLLTVTHDQDALTVHRAADGTGSGPDADGWSVEGELGADVLPGHPEAEPGDEDACVFFDYEGGFVDEGTAVVGTVESDEESGAGRHWFVDLTGLRVTGEIAYPFPVSGLPRALGDGTWYTASAEDDALHVWAR
ncbi:hypothetical protein ACFWUZ_00320 [Streptomyces sp. NPDC058646]|uniref:hypothetical protein n=1 Tax=Streptomyces sp. NPDC058646 TaxID=3346574 RepID=UPI00365FEF2B